MTRLGRWAVPAALLALTAAAAGCGGSGDKAGGASATKLVPFDPQVRCGMDPTRVGCREGAPAGTRFAIDDDGQRWTVEYAGAKVARTASGDPVNPQRLMVITTIKYSLLASAGGPVTLDGEEPFHVDAYADRSSRMGDCGQRPEAPTVRVGQTVTVQNCFSSSGPPSLLEPPLSASLDSDRLDGHARLEVDDVPAGA
jgi:hypothetical protein